MRVSKITFFLCLIISNICFAAIVDSPEYYLPNPPTGFSSVPNIIGTSSWQLNSATDELWTIFQAPITGSIDKIGFRTANITTGATLDVRLETLDLTTGGCSGSLIGTDTNASVVVNSTDDNIWVTVTLTSPASVNRGDFVCLNMDVASGTPSAFQVAYFNDSTDFGMPVLIEQDGTPAYFTANSPIMALSYQTDGYVNVTGTAPIKDIGTYTYNSTSTPDVYGAYFEPSSTIRLSGVWVWMDLDNDAVIKVYNSSGTVITSISIDEDMPYSGTLEDMYIFKFSDAVTLTAGEQYFIGIEPVSATNITLYSMITNSSDEASAFPAGNNFMLGSAKDPGGSGTWTVSTVAQPFMGLIIDGFDSGGSSVTTGHAFVG